MIPMTILLHSQGGMEWPVVVQKITLSGKGRFKNRDGLNFPMLPIRIAKPRTALPTFLIIVMAVEWQRTWRIRRYARINGLCFYRTT